MNNEEPLQVEVTEQLQKPLLGLSLDELGQLVAAYELPRYTAKQLADWLYVKRVEKIEEMTNLSKQARERISKDYVVGRTAPILVQDSKDGTRKYLFSTAAKTYVEAVMIPDGERKTLCVSSQAGCKMNCSFCMTGRTGWQGNLHRSEILNQVFSVSEASQLTNIVFMGMGEPLDNTDEVMAALEILTAPWGLAWSPKRVTLSTIGVHHGLERFLQESRCHLAISIHTPFAEERANLMPAEVAFPIEKTIELLRAYDFSGQRRLSFEYIVFSGLNDTEHHAAALAEMLSGFYCRVNLIRFHRIPDSSLPATEDRSINHFQEILERKGLLVTIRQSRGEDIAAACGMLSATEGRE